MELVHSIRNSVRPFLESCPTVVSTIRELLVVEDGFVGMNRLKKSSKYLKNNYYIRLLRDDPYVFVKQSSRKYQ